jgi:hypothetical protein
MNIFGKSLPPLVTGELRGEVEVSVLHLSLNDYQSTRVSVSPRWWGSQETDEESEVCRLFPTCSTGDASEASIASALIEADTIVKNGTPCLQSAIIYPIIAELIDLNRYFSDATTLSLLIQSGVDESQLGMASIPIKDTLGCGQSSLVGVANVENESKSIGSLVFMIRVRSGQDSSLLSEKLLLSSRTETFHTSNDTPSLMSTEAYLTLLTKRSQEVKNADSTSNSESGFINVKGVNNNSTTNDIVDLDITYPLAASTMHRVTGEKESASTPSKEQLLPSPSLPHSQTNAQRKASPTSLSNSSNIISDIKSSFPPLQTTQTLALLQTSFEVAEQVASQDVHNLLSTPSSLLHKKSAAEEREKRARNLSGGLLGRASRGTSPVYSSPQQIDSSSFQPIDSSSPVSHPHISHNYSPPMTSNGAVSLRSSIDDREILRKSTHMLDSPFADTAPRPDGVNEVFRASEKNESLQNVDIWSSEALSSAQSHIQKTHSKFEEKPHQEESPSPSLHIDSNQVTEAPSLWLAGIVQPESSRSFSDQQIQPLTSASNGKTSIDSLNKLLNRSSTTLKEIDEALIIGRNVGGVGPLHARATHSAAATALGARLKAASSTLTSTDISTTFPSTISSNLSKSDAILIAYQEVVSALDSGAFGSSAMAAFENNINNNSSITAGLLGVDPRTISIINEAASSSMGGLILSDKPGDETYTKSPNSLKRDNDSLSSVLQDASVDYTRLKDALATAESALRLPSLSLLGERLRSLSKHIHGISVSLSTAILFPAATISSAHQSSGRFGSIALLAIGEEKNDNIEKNNNLYRNPRVLKQQSAQALKDWLGGCKVWLEYTISPGAAAIIQRRSHSSARNVDESGESRDVYNSWRPGAALSVSVMSQPVAFSSSHSQTSSNDHLIGDGKIRSKSSSPEKPISATTSSIRKTSSPPPRGSPLRLSRTSNAAGTSSSSPTTPPKQIPLSTQIPSPDPAQLLLASLPPPSLSIPPGHVSDWDMSHSAMKLDSLIHTRENEFVFDDKGLSLWLGNVKGEGQGDEMITDSSSSIIVRMYLDASSQHQNDVNSKSAAVSTLPLKGKPPSPPKGNLSAEAAAGTSLSFSLENRHASSSTPSSPFDERVLIGEGRLPLRQLLLSDSLSFETTVDVLNINSVSQLRNSHVSKKEKTLSTLRQVRSTSLNATSDASLVGPLRISADVVNSRQEAFLSSLSLSSEERDRVQRALAVRIAAAKNDTVESKRAISEALSPLSSRIERSNVIEEIRRDTSENKDSSLSCTTQVSSEVVARVRMRVSLLYGGNNDMRNEATLPSSHTLIDTLRSLPQQPTETETETSLQLNHKPRSLGTQRRALSCHSLPPNLRSVLGPDWETLRLPASSFILQSTSGVKKTRDITKSESFSFSQLSRHSSSLKSSVSDLARVLLGESDAGEKENDDIDRVNDQGSGSSLNISLHSLSSVSPRSALTAMGNNPSTLDDSSAPVDKTCNNSSIISVFIRAQPNRAIFSIPRDKPHIDIPSARMLESDASKASSIPSSLSTLPKFNVSSDLVLPIRAPSSIKDAEGLASALFSSNRSGCILEVYGFIATSRNTSNVNESTPLKHFQLISQEPILLGTVLIPLAGVADALTRAARSESSLWDGPERITSCPNVLQIVHPTVEEWSPCGQLSLSLWAAANGRQALVFTGQSSAALEIQKWWSIIVVFVRKRRMEEEKRKRLEEEEEKRRKAEEVERAKVEKGTGKKTQKRSSPVRTGQVGAVSRTTASEALVDVTAVAAVIKDMKEKSPIQPDEILQSSTFQFQQSISSLATPWDVESILPSQVNAEKFPQTDLQLTQKGDNSAQPESNLDSSASCNLDVINIITSDESLPTQHIDMSIKGPDSSEESRHAKKDLKSVIPLVQDVEVQTDGIILVDNADGNVKSLEDEETISFPPSDTIADYDHIKSEKENEEGPSQPSLIADRPRLRIEALIDTNNEREIELLPSSHALFPIQSTSSQDKEYLRLSIDDFLLQLECEEFDNATNVYNNLDEVNEEKIDTISEIDDFHVQETIGIAETTSKDIYVYEFTQHEGESKVLKTSNILTSSDKDNQIFTSSEGNLDVSKSVEVGVEVFKSFEEVFHVNNQTDVLEVVKEDVGPAHFSEISISHPKQTNSTHVPVVSDIVIDSSEALIIQSNNLENVIINDEHSEAEIYSLDFESVTHMEEEHEKNNEESEDEEEEDCNDNYMNSAENADDIPGYIIPNNNEEISMEGDSFTPELISHPIFSNNQNEIDINVNENDEDDDQDQHFLRNGQERISDISFHRLNSQQLNKRLNVYKDQMHKESTDLSLSRSASPESLLELLLRQEELYSLKDDDDDNNDVDNVVYNTDNRATGNDDAVYNTTNRASDDNVGNSIDRNQYHSLSDINDPIPNAVAKSGLISAHNRHHPHAFTSSSTVTRNNSTVPTSTSITLSEIEDALASTEHTINFNLDERVDEDRHMDESPSETVSQLLGATFEAEVSAAVAAVAVDDREKFNATILPSIMNNHITGDVSAWNDLVAVVDRWVESQRRMISSSSASSGEPEVNVTLPSQVADKEPEQLVPVSIPVIGTIFVSANLSQERRLYLERLITENSALISQVDSLHVPVVNHTAEKISETIDDHIRLRESLGLPMSKELSLSSSPSRRPSNDRTTRSKTHVSSSAEEKRSTPKRFVDVRDTDKLAALLRGVR